MSAVETPKATYNLEELETEVRNVRQKLKEEFDAVSMFKCPNDKYNIFIQDMGLGLNSVPVPDSVQGEGVEAFQWEPSSDRTETALRRPESPANQYLRTTRLQVEKF